MPRLDDQISRSHQARDEANDPMLTVREVAELLNASVPTLWRWAAKGIVPQPVKLGSLSRWPRSEILAVIEAAKARRA